MKMAVKKSERNQHFFVSKTESLQSYVISSYDDDDYGDDEIIIE